MGCGRSSTGPPPVACRNSSLFTQAVSGEIIMNTDINANIGRARIKPNGGTDSTTDEPLLDRLRGHRWRITPQRRAILQALAGEHVHRTAEQIHAAARAVVPEVSLATVYNTLNELVSMGEITELHIGDGSARYDPKVGPDHHHLLCVGCGRMFDVEPAGVDRLAVPADQRHNMRIDTVEVTFRGRCADCLAMN
jgi:Fur family transcriptional regulator, stress-responsive regulator